MTRKLKFSCVYAVAGLLVLVGSYFLLTVDTPWRGWMITIAAMGILCAPIEIFAFIILCDAAESLFSDWLNSTSEDR